MLKCYVALLTFLPYAIKMLVCRDLTLHTFYCVFSHKEFLFSEKRVLEALWLYRV